MVLLRKLSERVATRVAVGSALSDGDQGRAISTSFTDTNGNFGLFGLQPGDYMVTVAAEGFKSELRMVHVTDNRRSRVDIALTGDPLRAQSRRGIHDGTA